MNNKNDEDITDIANQFQDLKIVNENKINYLENELEQLKLQLEQLELKNEQLELKNEQLELKNEQLEYEKTKKNVIKDQGQEIWLKTTLFEMNKNKNYQKLITIFGSDAEEGISILNLDNDDVIDDISKVKKAPANCKADIRIKINKTQEIFNCSVKSFIGGNPSIINHTPRSANVFQENGKLNFILSDIDKLIIPEYIKFRNTVKEDGKKYSEEIMLGEFRKLKNFDKIQETLIKIIRYFMFDGSGNNEEKKIKANSLLIINKQNELAFFPLLTKEKQIEYIKFNFNRFDLALVSRKGLPKNIKFKEDAEKQCEIDSKYNLKYQQMKPWIYFTNDAGTKNSDSRIKIKGAIHVRFCIRNRTSKNLKVN